MNSALTSPATILTSFHLYGLDRHCTRHSLRTPAHDDLVLLGQEVCYLEVLGHDEQADSSPDEGDKAFNNIQPGRESCQYAV